MKPWLFLLLLAAAALNAVPGPVGENLNYYVQLIRGDNSEKPSRLEEKPIGAKLSKTLRSIFNFRSYWELNRQQVTVAPGQKTRVRLARDREVEIDLALPGKRVVTAYEKNQPVSRIVRAVGKEMTIAGGDCDDKTVWFIIVRRDKPQD